MSTTPASTRPDTDRITHADVVKAMTTLVSGDDTMYARLQACLPAVIELYGQVRSFVEGEHGQAIAAYWKAWEQIEVRPDWMNEASCVPIDDVDVLMYGIVGLLEQMSQSYPECPALDQSLAEMVIDRHRGEVAQ